MKKGISKKKKNCVGQPYKDSTKYPFDEMEKILRQFSLNIQIKTHIYIYNKASLDSFIHELNHLERYGAKQVNHMYQSQENG